MNYFKSVDDIEQATINYDLKYENFESEYSIDYVRNWVRLYTSLMDYAGGTLLDIGCGLGDWSIGLAEDFEVDGIDISGVAIEKARRRSSKVNFIKGDVFDLRSKYDVVFCRGLSVFNRCSADPIFQGALSGLLELTGKLFIYCAWTEKPYEERYKEADGRDSWYKHDPSVIGELFKGYGDSRTYTVGNYLFGEIRR